MARPKRKVNPLLPVSVPTAPSQRVYRTCGYARLSVEDSGKSGSDTIATQIALIRKYIDAQPDMQLAGMFSDNGRTGTNFDRPAFEHMMDEIRAGKIDCIVVKDLSRFGRNYLETGNYLERIFPFLDIRFVAINDNFDTLTAKHSSDGYIIPLKNIINAAYSKDISRKISTIVKAKQQKGEFTGSWAAYGYRKCEDDKHHIEPDEETAPVVKDIFQWRLSGLNVLQIVRRLNELGIPSPSRYLYLKGYVKSERFANGVWTHRTVKELLAKEVYLGHMVQGRKRSGFREGQKQRKVSRSEWVVVRNTHEPLIDEETFFAVQKLAEESHAAHNALLDCHGNQESTSNILRGLVYCADCKHAMARTSKGANHYVYICPIHFNAPESCPKKWIHETKLTELLWAALQKEIALAGNMEKLIHMYQHSPQVAGRAASLNREIAAAAQALKRAKTLYNSLYQNYADQLISEQEYKEMKIRYKADVEQAQARLETLEKEKKSNIQQVGKNSWLTAFGCFKAESELTYEMAHALIKRVEVDADNHVTITLRYRDEYLALVQFLDSKGGTVPV